MHESRPQRTIEILSYLLFDDYVEYIMSSLYIPVRWEDEYEYNTPKEGSRLA